MAVPAAEAVTTVVEPDRADTEPTGAESAHAMATPLGHGPGEHVGTAVNVCIAPAARDTVAGVTTTPVRAAAGSSTTIGTEAAATVTPWSVPVALSHPAAFVVPAVNSVVAPVAVLSEPSEADESAQVNVVPVGHARPSVHAGAAEKFVEAPGADSTVDGPTVTLVKSG